MNAPTGEVPHIARPPLPDAELLARARGLVRHFASLAAGYDSSGAPPKEQVQNLFEADLLRLTIARRDGGHGAGLSLTRRIVQTIAEGDPSVALIASMHYSQHASIARSQRQKGDAQRQWPPALAQLLTQQALQAPALVNAVQVEPELGSPSHGGVPATIARRTSEGWSICGHKIYSTGSHLLDWLNVLAITDEPEPRLGQFLVPRTAPGVRLVETWKPLGMRSTVSHDFIFEDAAIPLDHAVGLYDAAQGQRRDAHAFAWYLGLVGSVYTGVAVAARDWLIEFLKNRKPTALNGSALASLPTVQEQVGRIQVLVHTSETLLDAHARAYDADEAHSELGLTARHVAMENAARATALALELAGNHGISGHHALERHFRDAQCGRIHAPSAALIRGNLGRELLKTTLKATEET